MSLYKVLNYAGWREMKKDISQDICGADKFPYNRYVFRGHSNENWKLTATFDRIYGSLPFDKRKELEKILIEDFKDLCIYWEEKEKFQNYTKIQLMSIGQHYGLPTRLLDWTFSIYIASFFAFSDIQNMSENIVIWVLDSLHEVWNADYGVTVENVKVDENARQRYQYGVFTLNKSSSKTIEDYIESCAKEHSVDGALYKIILPAKDKKIVLSDLEMMGINPFTINRGLEGCARTAVLRAFMK